MDENFITIKISRDHGDSNPYEAPLETALQNLGLPEISWETTDQEGYIRHETGPEIIALAAGLVSLATAIIGLVSAFKNRHPETQIQITVNSADELERVLDVLKDQ